MIVTLWHRADRGLRMARLSSALTALPISCDRGPIVAFSSMVRRRAMRPHTIALTVIRVGAP